VDGKHASDFIVSETDPTVPANLKDGISWSEVANIPADIADGDQVGITTEQDPKVGSITANSIPKWSGATSKLVDSSSIFEDASGKVGVGKASPAYKLDVNGTINAAEIFKNGAPFSGSSQWDNVTGGINYAGGNVGIGTTSPDATLHVKAPGNSVLTLQAVNNQPTIHFRANDGTGIGSVGANQNDHFYITGNSNGYGIIFRTNGSDPVNRMAITNEGRVGIGTINPNYRLTVKSSGELDGSINVINTRGNQMFGVWEGYGDGRLGVFGSSGSEDIHLYAGNEPSYINAGNVGIGTKSPSYKLHVIGDVACTGNFVSASDLRLKENITPLTNAIDKVSALRGVYFNFKAESPSERQVGVIAQEVEAVLPEVVSTDAQGYKSVDYSKLTPLLIEAVKELKAHDEELKAQNEELRARIEALESR